MSNEDTLKEYESNLGYDTCRKTTEYDASPCVKDCQDLEKSDFAKKCSKDGGFFKCCIRFEKKVNRLLNSDNCLGETQNIVTNADFAVHFPSAHMIMESQRFYLQTTLWQQPNLRDPPQIILMLLKVF